MPTARNYLAVGVVNGTLYAVGGNNGATALNTVEAYSPSSNTWSPKASMSTPRGSPGVAAVNGILYAVGGYDGTAYLDTVEGYNPSTDTWTSVASMPTARELLGAGVVNGILYAVGGVNSTASLATNEAFASPFFATFSASVKLAVASSSFNLNGSFALGATRSIDPRTQDVTVQVGGYSVTIPAGSFHRYEKGNFVFNGTINGVALKGVSTPLAANAIPSNWRGRPPRICRRKIR
jgi:hypothetical protein